MDFWRFAWLLLAAFFAVPVSARALNWASVKKIPPGALVNITTNTAVTIDTMIAARAQFVCAFQGATEDKLFCSKSFGGSDYRDPVTDLVMERSNIRDVQEVGAYDYSSGFLNLLVAAEGGGGWASKQQPDAFAGVKLGGALSLDLQYDRIAGQNGFSVEGSGVLPFFRFPSYHPRSIFTMESASAARDPLYFKLFAEPGVGYRAGGGPFGGYTSAKVLMLLGGKWRKSDGGASPYIEFQRRFPFGDPLHGDNRLAAGILFALCGHCG